MFWNASSEHAQPLTSVREVVSLQGDVLLTVQPRFPASGPSCPLASHSVSPAARGESLARRQTAESQLPACLHEQESCHAHPGLTA